MFFENICHIFPNFVLQLHIIIIGLYLLRNVMHVTVLLQLKHTGLDLKEKLRDRSDLQEEFLA